MGKFRDKIKAIMARTMAVKAASSSTSTELSEMEIKELQSSLNTEFETLSKALPAAVENLIKEDRESFNKFSADAKINPVAIMKDISAEEFTNIIG